MRCGLRRTVVVGLAAALVGAAAPPAFAGQDPVQAPQPGAGAAPAATAARVRDDGRRTLSRFPANLLRGTVGVFSTDNVKPLLIGGAATGVGAIFDDDVAEWIADPSNSFGTSLESGARPAWVAGVVAALFATGRAVDAPRFRAVTYDWMDAFLVNAAYTTVIKELVKRERPDSSDNLSFPSGHSSNAFALAVVAERHYGWKAGVPAYALASAVAVSRLQRNKHYLSDVLAGSTLGYIVGRTVVRVNGQPFDRPRAAQLSLSPIVTRHSRAVVAGITF
jgi:membrane-associated phospholipid phosphatase